MGNNTNNIFIEEESSKNKIKYEYRYKRFSSTI